MSDKTEDQIREGLKLLAEDVQPPEGESGRRAWTRRAPWVSPRLGVALAALAICAALAGLVASGALDGGGGGPNGALDYSGGGDVSDVPPVGGRVVVDRASDGTANLVHVGLRSFLADPGIQLEVVHSTSDGGKDVVYTTQVLMNPVTWLCATDSTGHIGPTGASGPIGWSGPHGPIHDCHAGYKWGGTLVPSDWRGGCQRSGEYSVVAGGVTLYKPFTCDAADEPVGPSGQSGPTG